MLRLAKQAWLTMLKCMLTDKFYCLLLSILSALIVVVTGIEIFDNSWKIMAVSTYLLFSGVAVLAVVTNLIFYRLLKEQHYPVQDTLQTERNRF